MYIHARTGPGVWLREDEQTDPKVVRAIKRANRRESRWFGKLQTVYSVVHVVCVIVMLTVMVLRLVNPAAPGTPTSLLTWLVIGAVAVNSVLLGLRPFILTRTQRALKRLRKKLPAHLTLSQNDPRLRIEPLSTYIHWVDPQIGAFIDVYLQQTQVLADIAANPATARGTREHMLSEISKCAGFCGDAIFAYRSGKDGVFELRSTLRNIVNDGLKADSSA